MARSGVIVTDPEASFDNPDARVHHEPDGNIKGKKPR
jgi:hypothetical protein